MKFILGKKVNMTQIWDEKSDSVAVTKIQAGPCVITQVKDDNTDNYKALQVAYGEKKSNKNISKPVRGHLKKAGIEKENSRYLREFRVKDLSPDMKIGSVIDVSSFKKGDIVDVVGISKGKGFQGVVKRYKFAGQDKTHGNKDQLRATGSIGAIGPARVFKGKRMPGRMGGDRVTIKNMEIVDIDIENNIIFIKGAVPGATNGLLMIKGAGDLIINERAEKENLKKDVAEETSKEDVVGSSENNNVKEEPEAKIEEKKEDTKDKEEDVDKKEDIKEGEKESEDKKESSEK
jgi:large subunit ribosomal protein L3